MFLVAMAQGILSMILNATDSVLAGYFCGEAGISAISVASPVGPLFHSLMVAFVYGCRMIYPEEIGRYDQQKANQFFSTAMTTAFTLSVIFLALVFFAGDRYFSIYHITGDTLIYAKAYFSFNKYVYVLSPFVMFLGQMVFCDGDEFIVTTGSVFYLAANIAFSIIGGAAIGMAGISLGTLLSGIGCLGIYIFHFFRKSNTLSYSLHFSFSELRRLVRYSFIDSSFFLFQGINGIIINRFILNRFGESYLAVYAVVVYALGLSGLFGALSEAMLPILNTYRGENNRDGMTKILREAFLAAIRVGLVTGLLIFIAAPLFPWAFSIALPELSRSCIAGVRIISLSFVFISLMTIVPAYYNSAGKVLFSTLVARCKDSFFYLLFIWILGSLFGMNGIWTGIMLCPIAASVLAWILLRLLYGKTNMLLLPSDDRQIQSWDLELSVENIMNLRDEAEKYLLENNVSGKTLFRTLFLVEEVFNLVLEKNANKRITAELTIFVDKDVEIIFRDDGIIFDITDEDAKLTSFRAYVISSFEKKIPDKRYALSMAMNRSHFLYPNI